MINYLIFFTGKYIYIQHHFLTNAFCYLHIYIYNMHQDTKSSWWITVCIIINKQITFFQESRHEKGKTSLTWSNMDLPPFVCVSFRSQSTTNELSSWIPDSLFFKKNAKMHRKTFVNVLDTIFLCISCEQVISPHARINPHTFHEQNGDRNWKL